MLVTICLTSHQLQGGGIKKRDHEFGPMFLWRRVSLLQKSSMYWLSSFCVWLLLAFGSKQGLQMVLKPRATSWLVGVSFGVQWRFYDARQLENHSRCLPGQTRGFHDFGDSCKIGSWLWELASSTAAAYAPFRVSNLMQSPNTIPWACGQRWHLIV